MSFSEKISLIQENLEDIMEDIKDTYKGCNSILIDAATKDTEGAITSLEAVKALCNLLSEELGKVEYLYCCEDGKERCIVGTFEKKEDAIAEAESNKDIAEVWAYTKQEDGSMGDVVECVWHRDVH